MTTTEANNKNVIDPKALAGAAPPPKKARLDDDAIPVHELRATTTTGIPLGAKNYQSITSGTPKQLGADNFDVAYLPRMACYRVRAKFSDPLKGVRTYLVPRELAVAEVVE